MKLRAPNALVLLSCILVVMAVLTWVITPGRYERKEVKTVGGTKQVVLADTYRELPAPRERSIGAGVILGDGTRQGAWEVLQAPFHGFGYEHAYETIGFILLIGGAFGVLMHTGAITSFLMWLVRASGQMGRFIMVPVLVFAFSGAGVTFGMAEESIAFAMIMVPLALTLRFDVATGIAIPFLGSQAGFATAFVNPFSFGIAKQIAGAPAADGYVYRIACWLITTTVVAAMLTWHAWRVSKDPSRSPTPQLDQEWRQKIAGEERKDAHDRLPPRHLLVVLLFAVSMAFLIYGSLELDFYITEMAAVFLLMALVCGLIGGLGLGEIADSFMSGAKDLAPTAILLAFARAIIYTADQGQIMDPILHGMSNALGNLGPTATSECMFAAQTLINFFVPSGSSQAAMTMPIMTPLAQIRQVPVENAILAFQFGDGFSNIIIPTNPVLMGVIAVGGMSYGTWFRWVAKYMLVFFLLGALFLAFSPL